MKNVSIDQYIKDKKFEIKKSDLRELNYFLKNIDIEKDISMKNAVLLTQRLDIKENIKDTVKILIKKKLKKKGKKIFF
jgi:hypothetical protein